MHETLLSINIVIVVVVVVVVVFVVALSVILSYSHHAFSGPYGSVVNVAYSDDDNIC